MPIGKQLLHTPPHPNPLPHRSHSSERKLVFHRVAKAGLVRVEGFQPMGVLPSAKRPCLLSVGEGMGWVVLHFMVKLPNALEGSVDLTDKPELGHVCCSSFQSRYTVSTNKRKENKNVGSHCGFRNNKRHHSLSPLRKSGTHYHQELHRACGKGLLQRANFSSVCARLRHSGGVPARHGHRRCRAYHPSRGHSGAKA